jgi:hypothetical protein
MEQIIIKAHVSKSSALARGVSTFGTKEVRSTDEDVASLCGSLAASRTPLV